MEQPGASDPPAARSTTSLSALDRWGAWLGTAVSVASLALVVLADLGWFVPVLAVGAVVLAAGAAAAVWRPPFRSGSSRPAGSALLAGGILVVGAALIAPGSENIVGPRDPGVYVATGFALGRWGSTTIHDPALASLAASVDSTEIDAWIYENAYNHSRIRFPAQLFIRDFAGGTVEGGFLPVLPAWIGLAASLGGLEAALHVAGAFGVLALIFAMLASAAAAASADARPAPFWPLVGITLSVSFAQVWWAREPMAESGLGALTWLVAWSSVRWIRGGGWHWAALAALAASAALLTRADGVLVTAALGLLALRYAAPGRRLIPLLLVPGLAAAGLHDLLLAPIYTSTTYGGFTIGRAVGGVAAVAVAVGTLAATHWLRRSAGRGVRSLLVPSLSKNAWLDRLTMGGGVGLTMRGVGPALWLRRSAVLVVIGLSALATLSGLAPGIGRDATLGAASPLAWLPGYVPGPILVLAAIGFGVWGWSGVPRAAVPLLLIGGLPALFYLPDPLVTGDHPWMVRRLVPAVIPLLAIAASVGAAALWRLEPPARLTRAPAAGPFVATTLVALGLALAVAQDRDLVGPRHAAGTKAGLMDLARDLPPRALVIFPAGPAGTHLAMPLAYAFGVDAFAVPQPILTTQMARTLARLEDTGRMIYWAADGAQQPVFPAGVQATRTREVLIHYESADKGLLPPPLQRTAVDDRVALYRLRFGRERA